MTRYLTADEVIRINESQAGPGRLRDRTLLESAVGRPQQSFGEDLYPTVHQKAAALMHSLVLNHPFEDGNKRTAVLAVYAFYGFNGYEFSNADDAELIHLAVDVALEHLDVLKIADFLEAWVVPLLDEEDKDDDL